jgi:arylsulfatase A-like enzyme
MRNRTSPPSLVVVLAAVIVVSAGRPALAGGAGGDARPNILFCFADDWGRYASAYAAIDARPSPNQVLKTPNIDRLAARGVLFRNAFVPAPSCTPCRSSLVSGRYFFRTGLGAILQGGRWDDSIPSFPLLLEQAGYHIGKSYKVWSPGTPADAPFGRQRRAFERAGRGFNDFSENVTRRVRDGETFAAAKEALIAELRSNFDAFLAARPAGAPFCYWFGPTLTHRRWVKGSGKALWGIDPDALKGRLPSFLPDVPELREDFADYLGEVQAWDAGVGAILERLEAAGETERTFIVVSGDHGAPGFPGGKCNLYDFGAAAALIAAWPGAPGGRVVDDLVSLMDLAPTFLEAGGIAPPAGTDGRSLLAILKSGRSGLVDPSSRAWVITGRERHVAAAREGQLPYPQRALRTRDFLYIRNFKPERWPMGDPKAVTDAAAPPSETLERDTFVAFADMDASPAKAWLVAHRSDPQWKRFYDYAFAKRPAEELYDLRRDPEQMANLAADPAYAEARRRLAGQLLQTLAERGDPRVVGGGETFERPPFAGEATSGRVWLGPQLWANRLQDWRAEGDRLVCVGARPDLPMRTAHSLTRRLGAGDGEFTIGARVAFEPPAGGDGASCGFLLGAGSGEVDFRAAALIHGAPGPGGGLLAGIGADGRLFFADNEAEGGIASPVAAAAIESALGELRLRLDAVPGGGGAYDLTLSAHDAASGAALGRCEWTVDASRLIGNLALFAHSTGAEGAAPRRISFAAFEAAGPKVEVHPEAALGPILSTQYTVSRGVLKLAAQLFPLGEGDPRVAALEVRRDGEWRELARAAIAVPGWTATFRVADWDAARDHACRVRCGDDAYECTVRRDPIDKPVIVLAGFTGNHNNRRGFEGRRFDWRRGVWFPHADLTSRAAKHRPDLLFFSGDQVYEGDSPTRPDRAQLELDYLYKWYLWCWAYRELTRSIPAVTIPDDHDVYQGNLWGEGGRRTDKDDKGGYVHPADFVRMVERTQTSHLPDPYDPAPVEQGIGVYYTAFTWGRIGLAVLEDRKFKSGCDGRVSHPGSTRADHIVDPDFDVRKADVPGLELLGKRQEAFLDEWAADWRGADLKVALSQTVFGGLATHHGPALEHLRADLDSNGWPQSGRRRALERLRKGFAFHLGGDQHLATLVHHGIDDWEDAVWSFAVPSAANFYPRKWEPPAAGESRAPGAPPWSGRHLDGLGNRVTVHAATNPGEPSGHQPAALHDRMPGYGVLRLDKAARAITVECWPRHADPGDPMARQYEGWPRSIGQLENYGRRPVAWLPELRVRGRSDPVVQIFDEASGALVYALRIRGDRFRPWVFAAGTYTVRVGEQEPMQMKTLNGVRSAGEGDGAAIEVEF